MLTLLKKGNPRWFIDVGPHLNPRVHVPIISNFNPSAGTYIMNVIKGVPLCTTDNLRALHLLYEQVKRFASVPVDSITWHEYLDSIGHRCHVPGVMSWLRRVDVPCGHFCHGDLTLENVLVDRDDHLYLIDPNTRLKFNSVHLDRGKLMFSRRYHDLFASYWLSQKLRDELWDFDWTLADRACLLTHIIRLSGYRPVAYINSWLSEEFAKCELL